MPLRRGAFLVYGQLPGTGTSTGGGGLFSGLSGTTKIIGLAAISVVVAAGVFVAAEAARPVIADIELAKKGRSRR